MNVERVALLAAARPGRGLPRRHRAPGPGPGPQGPAPSCAPSTLRSPVWRVVLALGSGEGDEVDEAHAAAARRHAGRARRRSRATPSRCCPSCAASPAQRLSEVLRAWGSASTGAGDSTTSRRRRTTVPRATTGSVCWREPGGVTQVLRGPRRPRLHRPSHGDAGPRVASRSPTSSSRCSTPPSASRGCAATSSRRSTASAPAAPPVLREHLRWRSSARRARARERRLAAEALGLVGAIDAVPRSRRPARGAGRAPDRAACSALGSLGVPGLDHRAGRHRWTDPSRDVRRAAGRRPLGTDRRRARRRAARDRRSTTTTSRSPGPPPTPAAVRSAGPVAILARARRRWPARRWPCPRWRCPA